MAVDPVAPFLWGSGGRRLTPEEIAAERKGAAALGQQAMSTAPVGHWSQGLNRVLQGLMAGYDDYRASDAAKQNSTESAALVQALLGGGTAANATAAPGATQVPVAAPVAMPAAMPPGADVIRSGLIQRGLPEPVADGFLMNFRDESSLNPGLNEAKPLVPGSRGGFGLAQWTGPRRVALEQFAANTGRPVDDVNTQLDFLMNELKGPEAAAAQSFMGAQTPQDAAVAIAKNFLRPAQVNLDRRVAQYSAGAAPSAVPSQIVDAGQPSPLDTAQYPAGPVGAPVAVADGLDPAALPTNAQPAQGVLPTAQAVQAATQPARPAINPAILQAMTSPYVNDQTRQIATLLFKSQMDQQAKASDPMRQLQMQKIQADLAAGKNPESVREYEYAKKNGYDGSFQDWIASKRAGAGEYSLTPVYGKDAQGNTVLIQPGKSGTAVQTKLPEGVTISSGVDKIDLGTQWGIIDKRTGQIVGYQPKDLKGAESEKALGKAQGGVKATLPSDIQNAESTIAQIDQLSMHPGLSSIVGPLDQFRPNWTMGAEGRDALARYNQLKGKAFLQAYSTLRGGGQITEVEGVKAENAMARMDRAQSEDEFKLALKDFRDAVQIGMQKLREKAGVAAPSAPRGKTSSGVSWSIQ